MKRSPMARGKSSLSRKAVLKRKSMKQGLGRVGELRRLGNLAARAFYFKHHSKDGLAPCQSCGALMGNDGEAQAHHKAQKGEAIQNKLCLCARCHLGFIHDLNHREHRKTAEHCPANVVNGFRIDWNAYGLNEAFKLFLSREAQPRGVAVAAGADKGKLCQGCRVHTVDGFLVYTPCILHQGDTLDPLFAEA